MRGLVGVDGRDGKVLRRVDDELGTARTSGSAWCKDVRGKEGAHREMQIALKQVLRVTRPNCCLSSPPSTMLLPFMTCTHTGADSLAMHE